MMNCRRESFVAVALPLPLLVVSQSPVCPASSQDVTVEVNGRSIVLKVPLLSIANPNIQEDANVLFILYFGPNSYELLVDRDPDVSNYFISSNIILNLPWPTQLIWIAAVVATVYLTHTRRSKLNV